MLPLALAAGLIPQIGALFTAAKQRRLAKEAAERSDGYYNQANGFANAGLGVARGNLATAQNAYNGRMAGAANLEQNIYGSQGNTLAAMGRNASSGSQLLALAGGVQGNTNQAFGNLAQQEGMNKLYQGQNLQMASQGVQGALGNLQNLNFMQGQNFQNAATQTGQASQINTQNALNGIGNLGITAAMGGFDQNQNGSGNSYDGSQNDFSHSMSRGGTIGGGMNPYQFSPPPVNYSLPNIGGNGYNFYQKNPYQYYDPRFGG